MTKNLIKQDKNGIQVTYSEYSQRLEPFSVDFKVFLKHNSQLLQPHGQKNSESRL
jgi:hypothetical protein